MIPILSLFLLFVVFGGGASRGDVQSLVLVRSAAVAVLAIGFFYVPALSDRPLRPLILFALLCLASVAVQLIPLPPSIWTALPGHEIAAAAGQAAGFEQPWRPISMSPDRTLNALVALFPPAAALVAAAYAGPYRQRYILMIMLGLVALSAVLGTLQMAAGPNSALRFYRITNEDAAVGLFSNRNHQALFLACGFPLAAWWIQRVSALVDRTRMRWGALAAAFVFLLLMILTTGSRGGLLLGLVSMALTLWLLVRLRPGPPLSAVAALALGVSVLAWFGWQRFLALNRLVAPEGSEMRVDLLGDFFGLFQTYFPIGSGYGSFQDVYRVVERTDTLSRTYLNNAHNDLAQIGIEGSVPALLLLGLALLWLGRAFLRLARTTKGKRFSESSQNARSAAIIIALLLLGSVVDYPLRTPLLASLFVACSVLLAYSARGRDPRGREDSAVADT